MLGIISHHNYTLEKVIKRYARDSHLTALRKFDPQKPQDLLKISICYEKSQRFLEGNS